MSKIPPGGRELEDVRAIRTMLGRCQVRHAYPRTPKGSKMLPEGRELEDVRAKALKVPSVETGNDLAAVHALAWTIANGLVYIGDCIRQTRSR